MPAKRIPIVGGAEPYAAIRTAPDPITLGPGQFALGQNLRSRGGVATVRNGMDRVVNLNNTSWSGENVYGAWFGNIGGQNRRIAAVTISGETCIYDIDTGTEITASSGKYGNTRLTGANDTQYWVQFAQIVDQLGTAVGIVACNGTDAPRLLTHNGSSWVCAIHQDIPIPDKGQDLRVDIAPSQYINIKDATGATLVGAVPLGWGTLADYFKYDPLTQASGGAWQFVPHGETSVDPITEDSKNWVYFASGTIDVSTTRQMWLVIDTADPSWLSNYAVSLGDDDAPTPGTEVYLWDPTDTSYQEPIVIPISATTKYLVLFNYTEDVALQLDAVKSLVFTWVKAAPPQNVSEGYPFWVMGWAFGGSEPGGTQWAFTRSNSGSKAESPGLVYSKTNDLRLESIGGPRDDGLTLPNVPEMLVNYTIRLVNPTTDQMSDGIDTVNLYSRMAGQDRFYLTKSVTAATYSAGVWNVASGYDGSTVQTTIGDLTTPVYPTQKQVVMPDGFTKSIPTDCVAPVYSSGRLIVASAGSGTGYERYDTIWVSDLYYPFRFRKAPTMYKGSPIEESGFTLALTGESARASIASSSGGLVGSVFYIGTDSSVYVLPGVKTSQMLQATRISPYGISHLGAMAEHNGAVAWHSTNNQVYLMAGGGVRELTYNTVDDRLDPITVSPYSEFTPVITMAFRDEKLYVGYRYTGSVTYHCDRCLVFDLRLNDWISDDVVHAEAQFKRLLTGVGGVGEQVLYTVGLYGSRLKVYEYDSPGLTTDESDSGSNNIAWLLRTRPFSSDIDIKRITVGRVAVFCTKQASGTITVTRGYRPSGVTASSSIDTSATPSELHRFDATITSSDTSVEHWGATAYVQLSGTSPGGFQIINAFAEVDARGDSADSNP